MMRGLVSTLESHHKVRIMDEGVIEAVKLSHRYIPDRQMPDKCVSVLDTACAKVAISQNAIPAPVEDRSNRIKQLDVAIEIMEREQQSGAKHEKKLQETRQQKQKLMEELEALNAQWEKEKDLIARYSQLRDKLEGKAGSADEKAPELSDEERNALKQQLAAMDEELAQVQGENPLMYVCVDAQAVASVVASWTGIPVGRMVKDEIRSVLELEHSLEERVIGQDHAMQIIARNIHTARAKLTDPKKPNGVFLFVGTSGVGKTETGLVLADLLYGGEHNLTTINMSEFKEEHKVSLLMGSPPGYVGYGEGGVLTEAVRRKPYSVILLDEMEKAHNGVQDIFYQVFDKGTMKDGEGRDIDFKNSIIIMTSNVGTDTIMKLCADPETMPDMEGLLEAIHDDLLSYFKPAFLGRVNVIPFYPLYGEALGKIVKLKLNKIVKRVKENYDADMTYSEELVQTIVDRCTEVDTGARNIDHILENSMLPRISAEFLGYMAEGKHIKSVNIGIQEDGEISIDIS